MGVTASRRARWRPRTGLTSVKVLIAVAETQQELLVALSFRLGGGIVGCQREDLPHLQVDPALAGADIANPLEQLIEVVGDAGTGRVLEPLIVQGKALQEILAQAGGSPLAELGAAWAPDAVADGENGGEAVVLDVAGNLPRPLGSNYPEFPDSCLWAQFAFLENVHQVLVDRPDVFLEQLRDQRLGQPDGLVLEAALDAGPPVLSLVEDEAGRDLQRQLAPIHVRQDHVGQKQLDLPGRLVGDVYRLLPIRRRQHPVSVSGQDPLRNPPDRFLILHQPHRLTRARLPGHIDHDL